MSADSNASPEAPAIHISHADYDLIAELAIQMEARDPRLSALILREIERAQLHESLAHLPDVVGIGSEVTFADDTNGSERTVELVLPGQADIAEGRVSVMTTVGAGLIGMRVGSEISWPFPDGRERSLTILRVKQGHSRR